MALRTQSPTLLLLRCLLGFAFAVIAVHAQPEVLIQARQVLALPSDTAGREIPVKLSGVVTASEPDWEGKFFVQDASGGIFVLGTDRQPQVGDVVSVEGTTARGAFAPVVANARWRVVGTAPLPPAVLTTIERLMSGVEDGQRVEFEGTARVAYFATTRKLGVDVAVSGTRLHVFPKLPPHLSPDTLVGAKVRVRGTVAASFNAALRQLTSINVFVPTTEDFVVEEPEPRQPFDAPVLPLGEIARYRPDLNQGGRVHVRGVVTLVRPGLDVYIQDGTGGLHLETMQALRLSPGDTVEAVGFLNITDYQPVLEDARCRRLETPPVTVTAQDVPYSSLRLGGHGGELIRLQGRLMGRTVSPVRRDRAGFVGVRTLSTVQNADLTFTIECEHNVENTNLGAVPIGSLVAVTGVASIATGDDGQLKTLTVLQRAPDDLHVLETPSWFTPQRLMIAMAALLVVAAAGIAWSVSASKKNAMLSFLIAEREKAQRELQQAHDQLERRVQERTEQLKVEMTARKSAEVAFRATLTERTRLARELHDTLEQALTGIALQLDTAAKLHARSSAEAERHVELARGFVRQSQVELRRSIWDLRSRELAQFDLGRALLHTSRQIAESTHLKVEVETTGTARPLPEIVEENLLRISQEALTNIVKHSGATLATIQLQFTDNAVTLLVRDNGAGLNPEKLASNNDRHFGLLGMAERSKRLSGRFSIDSSPGEGTTVTVSLPITPAPSVVPQGS